MSRLRALVWLRFRLWWNGLCSKSRVADTAVAVILAVVGVVVSVALAIVLASLLHIGLRGGDADAQGVALVIVFWTLAFFAVVLPLIFAQGQGGFADHRLLQYPFKPGQLYRLSLAGSAVSGGHLFWYPSVIAATAVALFVHDLPATGWCVVAAVFSVCLLVWCHTVLLTVTRVLQRRSIREIAALIVLVLVVAGSMVPAFIAPDFFDGLEYHADVGSIESGRPVVSFLMRAASLLPPGLAVSGVMAASAARTGALAAAVGALMLWIAAGGAVGRRLFGRMVFGGGGSPPSTRSDIGNRQRPAVVDFGVFPGIAAPVRAVAARDLLYLLRSTVGRFNIVIMPFFVAVMGVLVARDLTGQVLGLDRSNLVFLGVMIYASMFSNNFLYNAYAWEGAGIRCYFITPVTPRQVVFGKNLGLWIYNLILALECLISFAVVIGLPSPSVALSGCLAFATSLLASTVAGNFVSPAVPVARDLSKIGSSPSQTGILVSFGLLLANLVLIGGVVVIAALAATPWLLPILLSALLGLEVLAYRTLLPPAGRLLDERRESLVAAVQSPT